MPNLFRADRKSFDAACDLLMGTLLLCLLVVVALTYKRYGFTSDEAFGDYRATKALDFLMSLGTVTTGIASVDKFNVYGAMPDVLAVVLQKIFPSLSYDSRHLVSALFGVVGIYYVYRLGADFVNKSTGLLAALFLACNPMWFGYMFINAKDIPFAATLLASAYYALNAITGRHDMRWIWLRTGIAIGFFASTKLTGLVILCFIVLVMLVALTLKRDAESVQIDRKLFLRILMTGLAGGLGCLICFIFFWPEFYFFKASDIVNVVKLFANYNVWNGLVQIHGEFFNFDKVPRYYMLAYFTISMPLFLVTLIPAGIICSIIRREALIIAAALICITFFSYQAATRAQVYSGYRHFIFLLPFTSLIAAYPISLMTSRNLSPAVRAAALAIVAGGVIVSAVAMYRLFPYQYSFYNSLVGGIQGADGRYYVDVWRSAMREAFVKLDTSAPSGTVRVFSCGSVLNYAGHPRFASVADAAQADYIVSLRRGCPPDKFQNLPVVGDVRREGVVFAVIYRGEKSNP